jgi:choline dehydrogenase-like flavoprotein
VSSRGYDVLVLGGGTAGCVLASRLSENPDRSVCLVEAGPDYGPYEAGAWPEDMLNGRELAFSHSWETDHEDRSQLRAKILGGCSAHNACVVLPGAPADYDEWGPGWTYDEIEPYLRRAERQLRTRQPAEHELTPWARALCDAAGDSAIVNPLNAVGHVRWNTAFAYLDDARDRPNLTIMADTLVDRVLLDGDRAIGAVTSNGELNAGTVVVSASAYGSPAILLRSGIGPEQGLPVGEGLSDHVGVGCAWEPTSVLQEDVSAFAVEHPVFMGEVTVALRSSRCPEGVSDLFLFVSIVPSEQRWEIGGAAFAMKPRSLGRVRLNDADPRTPLSIDHGFLADPVDADVVEEGFEKLRELAASEPLRRYVAHETEPGSEVSAREHTLTAARGFFHPVGTCAIGSVVDPAGRVLGYENLVVGDASIMPTIPRANTNLSTAAVAERIAELVAE